MTAACGVLVGSGAPTSGRRVGCRPRNRTCDPCLGSGPRSRWLDAEGREEPIGPTAMPHGELARNDQRPPAARRQREQPILVDQRGERAAGGAAACRHVARGGMRGGVQVLKAIVTVSPDGLSLGSAGASCLDLSRLLASRTATKQPPEIQFASSSAPNSLIPHCPRQESNLRPPA
jgi:hypothetical protein